MKEVRPLDRAEINRQRALEIRKQREQQRIELKRMSPATGRLGEMLSMDPATEGGFVLNDDGAATAPALESGKKQKTDTVPAENFACEVCGATEGLVQTLLDSFCVPGVNIPVIRSMVRFQI